MGEHVMRSGVCIHCGCDAYAIDYFGWSCSGRSIKHIFHNGICTNCGFSKQVIEHFDWPCRTEPGKAGGGTSGRSSSGSRPSREKYTDQGAHHRRDGHNVRWTSLSQYVDEETRYGRLLGLKGKVTRGEIKYAYREQANLYHPDRVAHLGPEFQELANEKMKEINKAFAYFQKKYGL
jgi:hypothetical protein